VEPKFLAAIRISAMISRENFRQGILQLPAYQLSINGGQQGGG